MQNKELNGKVLEKIKNMGNENKGITLIALVVTIVILLILAGITIELTLGSNGIIQKTKFAKDQSCIQSDKEAIQIAYSTVYHLHDKVVTAQNLQEQLIYDGKDAECETVENNRIKVKIVKCEHEFLVDPITGEIENTDSDGKPVENKVSIEVDPSSNETESYKQQVLITVKSSRETITDNSVKILWTTNDSDDEPAGLANGTDLSVENKDEKTMNSETVYTATTSGDYYLWVKASINGKSASQKFGPYKLLAAPSAKDIIFTPSTVAPTTSLNVKIEPSANFPGYVLQYQVASTVNSKNWKNYTSEVNITENTTIWARLYSETEDKEVVSSFVVTNICLHTSGWKVQGDNHYCELCGYSEKHNYDQDIDSTNHRCSTCGDYASHTFQESDSMLHWCSECGAYYDHTYEYYDENSHRCSGCGYIEEHTYDSATSSGECTKCGTTCTHEFTYSSADYLATCTKCGYVCNHGNSSLGGDYVYNADAYFTHDESMGTSTCNYCGFVCDSMYHRYQSLLSDMMDHSPDQYHKCEICGLETQHNFDSMMNGKCMSCNYQCMHTGYWQYGYCTNCGSQCIHNSSSDSTIWNNGVCSICGESCDHTRDTGTWLWSNGVCTKCGMQCPHYMDSSYWYDGVCSNCGMQCEHYWVDGKCSICGKECNHNYDTSLWSGGVCMTCGMECQHQYDSTTGMCSICGMTCMHQYDSTTGRCSICGMECSHYFSNGVCMNCGYTDPSYSGS